MKRIITAIILVSFLAGCAEKKQKAVAVVTQRRATGEGKLMISYKFYLGENWVFDSVEVPNTVIPHDSLDVYYLPSNPSESSLDISK